MIVLEGYCRTLTVVGDGRAVGYRFGLDYVRYCEGEYHVLESAPALTGSWRLISWYMGEIRRTGLSLDEFWTVAERIRHDDYTGRRPDLGPRDKGRQPDWA